MRQNSVLAYLAVFLGGAVGSTLRHTVNQVAAAILGINFPWGTLAVNISGSIAIGMIAGWFAFHGESSQIFRLFLTTGIVGGFTTFSAFTLETALFFDRGQYPTALLYSLGSVILGVAGVFVGMIIAK